MKRVLIIVAVVFGLLLALIQVMAMLGASSNVERMVRAGVAGLIVLIMVIAYQKRNRPDDSE